MSQFSIRQFADTPVLLLHPEMYGYKYFLPDLLADDTRTLLYITLNRPKTTAAQFSEAICAAIDTQAGMTLPAFKERRNSAVWGRDCMAALQALSPYCLVIDAIDLLDEVACASLMQALLDNLSPGSQIILNGRRYPAVLLENPDLRDSVTLAPIDEDLMILDYMQPRERILLEVRALGPGRVLRNGAVVADWDGILPLHLFLFMVDRLMVSRSDIFNAFWPALPTREATNVFHVTKRKVNEILGFDLTDYHTGYYQLTPKVELQYDVVKFMNTVNESSVLEGEEAIAALGRAVRLYRSDFLSGLDDPWVVERREKLRAMYSEVLHNLSELHAAQGDDQSAESYYLRANAVQV
jgi:hypothetical protein